MQLQICSSWVSAATLNYRINKLLTHLGLKTSLSSWSLATNEETQLKKFHGEWAELNPPGLRQVVLFQ